jgi:Fe-Mn family superoxide dismutase|tara:strand:- start:2936 stop:3490 length:555 start_codon:yes stop_codon:yes gene_type:complete
MLDMIELLEAKRKLSKIEIVELPYSNTDLSPVLSKQSIEYHYGSLAHGYADRYNKGEGDKDFNYAGAFLHNIYFPQFRKPQDNNIPNGPILTLIKRKYRWWKDFKKEFQTTAMSIQGSGWIYLSYLGDIKTITNHEVREDILILVDWWEHAWALDYQADKKQYLENIWKIMNWNVINTRWGKSL